MPFNPGLNPRPGIATLPGMNLLLRSLAVGTLLTAATSFAADAFEGQVTMSITNKTGKAQEMDLTIKGQQERMDTSMGGHDASIIFDMAKREMTILMHEQHMYMVRPMTDIPKAAEGKSAGPESTADLEKTGKTETILGYKCQQFLVKEKNSTTEMWLAEGLGTFLGLGGGNPMGGRGGAAAAKWEQVLKGTSGFPLRVVSHDATGKESFKMEATRVTPGPQPASEFLPPEGYQKFAMPNFGG